MGREVEDIKQRLDIIDIVQEYFQLKKAGNNYKAVCPFHQESSPSFMVSQSKQIWHCFGCHEGGDMFSFLQKIEGIDFYDSLKLLAQRAGVKISKQESSQQKKKDVYLEILDITAKFFHKILLDHPKAQLARDYWQGRQIGSDTLVEFSLGYAPDSWDTLLKFLLKRGFSQADIIASGIVVYQQENNRIYDRFRNRITIPLCDVYGNTVGFTARKLVESDTGGKYINTPQTYVYDKSRVVFALSKAKKSIKELGQAVIVEGNMDVISSHQAGIKEVVAVSGTAFTENQINLLKRFTDTFIFAFDADSAGEQAARKAIVLALKAGVNVRVLSLPEGKDPDDLIRKDSSLWQEAIKNSLPVMDHIFMAGRKKYNLSQAEGKKTFGADVISLLQHFPNPIEREHYLQRLATELQVSLQALRELTAAAGVQQQRVRPSVEKSGLPAKKIVAAQQSPVEKAAWGMVAILLKSPQLLPDEELDLTDLVSDTVATLYKKLKIYYSEGNEKGVTLPDIHSFIEELPEDMQSFATNIQLYGDKEFSDLSHPEIKDAFYGRFHYLRRRFLLKQLQQVQHNLQEAELKKDAVGIAQYSEQFSNLTSRLAQLK